jgi:hypothetical protein
MHVVAKGLMMTKTINIFVAQANIKAVAELIRQERVKHWPFVRCTGGYQVTMEDSPVASYLALKY